MLFECRKTTNKDQSSFGAVCCSEDCCAWYLLVYTSIISHNDNHIDYPTNKHIHQLLVM